MAVEESSLVEQLQDRVGEIVTVDGRRYRIIGDDFNSKPLRKEWDYLLEDVETKKTIRVFANRINDSSK